MRMKSLMNSHVNNKRHTMFRESTNNVGRLLKTLAKEVRKVLDEKVDEIYMSTRRDYLSALGGGEAKFGQVMPKAQRKLRKKVTKVIDRAERLFERTINPGGTDDDDQLMDDDSDSEAEEEDEEEEKDADITRPTSTISDLTNPAPASSIPAPRNGPTIKRELAIKDEPMDDAYVAPAMTGIRPSTQMHNSQSQTQYPAARAPRPSSNTSRPNSSAQRRFIRPDMSALTGDRATASRCSNGRFTSAPLRTEHSINSRSSASNSPPLRTRNALRELSATTSDDRSEDADGTPEPYVSEESDDTDMKHAFSEVDSDEAEDSPVLSESELESDGEVETPASDDSH